MMRICARYTRITRVRQGSGEGRPLGPVRHEKVVHGVREGCPDREVRLRRVHAKRWWGGSGEIAAQVEKLACCATFVVTGGAVLVLMGRLVITVAVTGCGMRAVNLSIAVA